jgi:predicted PurR-regulated permease PerM
MDENEKPKIDHLLNRRVFFGILFLLVIVLVLALIWPYLNVIIFSVTIVMLLRPVYTRIYNWKRVQNFRASKGLATALTIIAFILVIAIPITILALLTFSQVKALSADITSKEFVLEDFLDELLAEIERLAIVRSIEFDRQSFLETITDAVNLVLSGLIALILKIGASFPTLLINLFLFFGFLVTLLPAADSLRKRERALIPLENPIVEAYATKISLMTRSMFLGIFVLSFVQGSTMGVFYVLAGIPYAAFWTALSIAFSVLPLVGISLIVLPMSIILILNGDVTSAIIVLGGFYGFANWIDTILRPKLVPKGAYLHPMLLILSVFGGLGLAGLLGVVYGPVIMIVFVTTLELYRTYFLGICRPEEDSNEVVLAAE